MAKIQISFQDNSDNEDSFKIYRGANTPVVDTDDLIMEVEWDATTSNWSVSGTATNAEITQGGSVDPTQTGQQYVVIYDEGTIGDYYYGVSASNEVGDSAISTSSLVSVAG
jgi:hypothetical protein